MQPNHFQPQSANSQPFDPNKQQPQISRQQSPLISNRGKSRPSELTTDRRMWQQNPSKQAPKKSNESPKDVNSLRMFINFNEEGQGTSTDKNCPISSQAEYLPKQKSKKGKTANGSRERPDRITQKQKKNKGKMPSHSPISHQKFAEMPKMQVKPDPILPKSFEGSQISSETKQPISLNHHIRHTSPNGAPLLLQSRIQEEPTLNGIKYNMFSEDSSDALSLLSDTGFQCFPYADEQKQQEDTDTLSPSLGKDRRLKPRRKAASFDEELCNLFTKYYQEENYDAMEDILWKMKANADRLSSFFREMNHDLLNACNKCDHEPYYVYPELGQISAQAIPFDQPNRRDPVQMDQELSENDQTNDKMKKGFGDPSGILEGLEKKQSSQDSSYETTKKQKKKKSQGKYDSQSGTLNASDLQLLDKISAQQQLSCSNGHLEKEQEYKRPADVSQNLNSLKDTSKLFRTENATKAQNDNLSSYLDASPTRFEAEMSPEEELQMIEPALTNPLKYLEDIENQTSNQSKVSNYSGGKGRKKLKYTHHQQDSSHLKGSSCDSSMKQRRETKFKFKKELHRVIKLIQSHNENLFCSTAFKKHMQQGQVVEGAARKNSRSAKKYKNGNFIRQNSELSSIQGRANGGSSNSYLNQLSYENENFFETNNDNLIDIKNIFENRLFWERVNTFFTIKVFPQEIKHLDQLYKLTPVQTQQVIEEYGTQVNLDQSASLADCKPSQITREILQSNDDAFIDPDHTCPPGSRDQAFISNFKDELQRQYTFNTNEYNRKSRDEQKVQTQQRMKYMQSVLDDKPNQARDSQNNEQHMAKQDGFFQSIDKSHNRYLNQLLSSVVLYEKHDFNYCPVQEEQPDLSQFMVPASNLGIQHPQQQRQFLQLNEYVQAELMSLDIIKGDQETVTKGIPDEVGYLVRLLQKELTNTKAQNILQTKNLVRNVLGLQEQERMESEFARQGKQIKNNYNVYQQVQKRKRQKLKRLNQNTGTNEKYYNHISNKDITRDEREAQPRYLAQPEQPAEQNVQKLEEPKDEAKDDSFQIFKVERNSPQRETTAMSQPLDQAPTPISQSLTSSPSQQMQDKLLKFKGRQNIETVLPQEHPMLTVNNNLSIQPSPQNQNQIGPGMSLRESTEAGLVNNGSSNNQSNKIVLVLKKQEPQSPNDINIGQDDDSSLDDCLSNDLEQDTDNEGCLFVDPSAYSN